MHNKWLEILVFWGVLQQYASSQVANAGNTNRYRFDPWVRKMPWSRKWQHTSVFLPGEPHGQRSLGSYSPWRRKELNMTEPLCTHTGWETHSRPEVHSMGSHPVFLQQHPGGRSHSSTTPQQYIMKTWWKLKVNITQSCPTLCNSMDYTVHGILQARILEWVAFPFSKGSSKPRDWTQVSPALQADSLPAELQNLILGK